MTDTAKRLKRRIRIEKPNNTPDGSGGKIKKWALVVDRVPAEIIYPPPAKKGDESFTQQQVHSALFATITIRYRPSTNLSADMRIVFGSRLFEIRTIFPVDENKQTITIQCEELQAKGTLKI